MPTLPSPFFAQFLATESVGAICNRTSTGEVRFQTAKRIEMGVNELEESGILRCRPQSHLRMLPPRHNSWFSGVQGGGH